MRGKGDFLKRAFGKWLACLLILTGTGATASDEERGAGNSVEEVFPDLLRALQRTDSANSQVHANLQAFAKSLNRISSAIESGIVIPTADLAEIAMEYKARVRSIAEAPDEQASVGNSALLASDAELKARFIEQLPPGLSSYAKTLYVQTRVQIRHCTSNEIQLYYHVSAVPVLLEPMGRWKSFEGQTDSAYARLSPGTWLFKASRDGREVKTKPFAVGERGPEATISFCVS